MWPATTKVNEKRTATSMSVKWTTQPTVWTTTNVALYSIVFYAQKKAPELRLWKQA